MRIFNAESPLMEGLSRVFDLMILNLIVLVCCLPVFTAGAALTAMHYVLIKMVRDEDGYLIRSYLRSFKENFVQATGMWLIFLVFMAAFVVDLGLVGDPQGAASRLPAFIRYALIAGGISLLCPPGPRRLPAPRPFPQHCIRHPAQCRHHRGSGPSAHYCHDRGYPCPACTGALIPSDASGHAPVRDRGARIYLRAPV